MGYKNLLKKIDELKSLVEGWDAAQPTSQIEMDMALDRVKKIYELLRFPTEEADQEQSDVAEVIKPIEQKVEPEIQPEPEVMSTSEPEPVVEPLKEEDEEMILDIDILKSAKSEQYNKILSLYCDLESQEPIIPQTPEPEVIAQPEPTPIVEQSKTIISTTTVKTTTESSHSHELYKISSQLGINDRFLLANDLFGGDISALSETLAALDELTNLDDVMIYIAENYKWDGDSEGAKLLFTLLQNRFL